MWLLVRVQPQLNFDLEWTKRWLPVILVVGISGGVLSNGRTWKLQDERKASQLPKIYHRVVSRNRGKDLLYKKRFTEYFIKKWLIVEKSSNRIYLFCSSSWGFYSNISGNDADRLLMCHGSHGSFLCRRSGSTPGAYTLSVRYAMMQLTTGKSVDRRLLLHVTAFWFCASSVMGRQGESTKSPSL